MNFSPNKKILFFVGSLVIISLGLVWNLSIRAGREFPREAYFMIREGESLGEISEALEQKGIIRSPLAFRGIVELLFLSGNDAVAGYYFFEKPMSVVRIAWRIIHGDFNLHPIKITIPEGFNKFEIAKILKKNIPLFDDKTFLEIAEEGYIFPDTYYFTAGTSPADVLKVARDNFDRKIEKFRYEIAGSGKSLDEIINMASILETEARLFETRKIISGILWKRLSIGMPLQVDVSFRYVNGKSTFELTLEDLSIDSPYNTYKYAGLPPTPIGNPGLEAIEAALFPEKTKYLYFLSDKSGKMHYAVTFDEHKKNKEKYLNL